MTAQEARATVRADHRRRAITTSERDELLAAIDANPREAGRIVADHRRSRT